MGDGVSWWSGGEETGLRRMWCEWWHGCGGHWGKAGGSKKGSAPACLQEEEDTCWDEHGLLDDVGYGLECSYYCGRGRGGSGGEDKATP